jgi:hypothetical protein
MREAERETAGVSLSGVPINQALSPYRLSALRLDPLQQ